MELRDFAEQVLFADRLEQKLWSPPTITDERPGSARMAPATPGRPAELHFKLDNSERTDFPGLQMLESESERGRLLHFFANHELLATELMALVLLRFPDAPEAFRRGVFQTLKDEQIHTRLYMERMRECGIGFGELPVSGYIWRSLASMENPMDYVAGLSLTFEQANLDFARHFANGFEQVGDTASAQLLSRIYHDEIGHVAYGLKWFRRWKDPGQSDWQAFCQRLKFPLSPQRAKGPYLNVEGRRAAGLDAEFIAELNVYSASKGRTPGVFFFNPLAEGCIAYGKGFSPKQHQLLLARDLANLPQFLCRQDDIVLVQQRPSIAFLSRLKEFGFPLPEFVQLQHNSLSPEHPLRQRKIGSLRPWAWSPDAVEVLEPLFPNLTGAPCTASRFFNADLAALYSKAWSAELLRKLLKNRAFEGWICSEAEVGIAVNTFDQALAVIAGIRQRGHHRIVVKQAYGLAGQNSIRLWEPALLPTQRRWLEHSLSGGRQLVIEPWLEREIDFSIQLDMAADGLKICGYTGLINDHRGQFQANWAAADFAQRIPARVTSLFSSLGDRRRQFRQLYESLVALLAPELKRANYFGPLGIDAFVYRSAEGDLRLKPLVELNPRYTMGRLTVELMKKTCPGSSGLLRLVNRQTASGEGFPELRNFAQALTEGTPVILEGRPVPKIHQGVICLNDPENARVSLALFQVSHSLEEILGTGGVSSG